MAVANLNRKTEMFSDGMDNIVIVNVVDGIRGGRTLDTTGFDGDVIKAGHLIIKETASGNYKPMPVSGDAYGTLPAGHTYAGVVVASVVKRLPIVGIMVQGTVNLNAVPFKMDTILGDVKKALPLIDFRKD